MSVIWSAARKVVVVVILLNVLSWNVNAATYYSRQNGNWNVNTSWSSTSNGGAVGVGLFPVAGDIVIIERNDIITITANAACASLQLSSTNANQAGTVTFSGGYTLTVSGTVTLGMNGNANRNGTINFVNGSQLTAASISFGGTGAAPRGQGILNMASGGTLSVGGAITVNTGGGTWTPGTGTVELTGINTLPATIFTSFNNLTINGGTTSLGAGINVGGQLNVLSGTLDATTRTVNVAGQAAVNGGNYLAGTATQTYNGGLLVAGGSFTGSTGGVTVTNLTINSGTFTAPSGTFNVSSGIANNGGTFTAGTNTVTFNGAGAKTISGSVSTTFQNVIMNTAGAVVNVNQDITINGTLSWSANGLLIVNATSNVKLGASASITSPTANRYIQLDDSGVSGSQLIRINDGVAARWQFLFPIGTSTGGYQPLNMSTATVSVAPTVNSMLAVKALLATDATGRLKRTFRMTVEGNANATTFSGAQFNYSSGSDVSSGDTQASYTTLWYQKESVGTWTALTGTAPGTTFFTGPSVAQTLANDTYYFTIGSSIAYGGNVWYSYQSGNWDNPTSWTTDGSLFPLLVNPGNAIPGPADNVVITSGRTMIMNVNNVAIQSLSITGTLDLLASSGHNFTSLSGSGRIRMGGTVDNFPSGTVTEFADAAVGGTVEVYGTALSLNQARTFNDLVVNMTGVNDMASLLSTITLNGDLTINNGVLRFGDNVSTVNRTLTVNGDVVVAASGGIRTGTGNNSSTRHEFNLYGDFTNNNTAYFTNRTAVNLTAEATDGRVDVNFLSSTQNQTASCNAVTRFYRIEIAKGTDATYKVTLLAADPSYFNLFGPANYNIDEANPAVNGNGTNLNALGLNYGTVELGANVTVLLNTVNNYAVYEGAALWVNGATVSKTGGGAVVPYGALRVSAGSLTVNEDSGLTLRMNGVISVEGGTVDVRAIRTSTSGAGAVGSYIQSGGIVTVTGGTVNTSYAAFSLTYPGNVFNMSGGTLVVRNRADLGLGGLRGAIFINSAPANISVTGGTVIMETNGNVSYKVTSKASFWNVIMRKTAGTNSTIELAGTTSGTGTVGIDELSLTAQPLTVLNNLTLEGATPFTFTTNNQNVVLSGDLEIQNGATYTPGVNTTTINGAGISAIRLGTSATQVFNHLLIDKTSGSEVAVLSGNTTAMRVDGTLTVNAGIFDYGSFVVSATSTVTLANGATVGKSASTGKLLFAGSVDQVLNATGSFVHNMEINNTDPSPVVTLGTGDLTIYKTLTLTSGIFNISTYKLSIQGAAASLAGAPFSVNKMIQGAGNSSDGGLEMYVDANESIAYPVGVAGKYTPALASISSYSDDGLVTLVPVNGVLLTTNQSGGADVLAYYWKANHSGFTTLPVVSYQFVYVNADAGGTESNYRPGKVLNASPFTRSLDGATNDVDIANNVITFNGVTTGGTFPGAGFTLEAADYTAGGTNRFTATLDTYYSVASGNWETAAVWSKNLPSGGIAEVPVAGSTVVIQSSAGNGHRINVNNTSINVASVQFKHDYLNSPVPNSENVPRLQFYNNLTYRVGVVTGTGMISFNITSSPTVLGDFGDFGTNPDSYFLYFGNGTSTTLTTIPTPIPNLMLESHLYTINQNITVNANLIIQGNAETIAAQNIRVMKDVLVGYWQGGSLRFPGTAPAVTVTVDGNIDFTQVVAANGNRQLNVINPGSNLALEHRLVLKGNLIQGADNNNVIDLYNAANRPWAALEFQGAGNHVYSRTSTSVPDLYRIICNKGVSQSSSFAVNSSVVLNSPTNSVVKSITINNGILKMNNTATYTLSSGGGNFDIPSTAGLEVSAGTVNMTTASTGITLSGLLRINGGTATLDAGGTFDNFIEYSNTGTAVIEVTSGALTVGSQVRRSLVANTGILSYTQSNGTVTVGNRSASSNSRGVFEILNTGSRFNHSGGSLTIVRGNGSATVPSVWLEPETSVITSGSTLTIGNASTPAGTIGIKSTAVLNNLMLAGAAGNTPVTKIYISPLSLNGNLTISNGNTLDAQNLNLTIGQDFTVDGTFTSGNNLTTFANAGNATISGASPTLSFYNFTKSGAGTLTLAKDITVNRDLTLSAGVFASESFAVMLKRHALVDGVHTSTSGQGLVFNGTTQQQLARSSMGVGSLGIVTINNVNGVVIPDGFGYDFSFSNHLRLQAGVFDIGGGLISLSASSLIVPVNSFSVTNMIQTNSSFMDKGLRKQFPTNYTTDFTFPVGQLYYTPVTFDFGTAGNTTGASGAPTITVRPANERHPSVIDNDGAGELPSPAAFNDLNNVLQYYWIINADDVASSFKSTMTLKYLQPMVAVTAPYTETDYISARILSDANPTIIVNKYNTADVNEVTNTITFSFSGVADDGISGDYFAGIDVAIPDNVPIYTTISSGDVDAPIYTPAVLGGGAPTGALVIVQPGHTVTLNINNISLYETQINAGGKIVIPTGSIGHRLGGMRGTGDLEVNSNTGSAVLPAAEYAVFFSCAGGGLIYGGTGTYDILGSIITVRKLTLEGAGVKTLANNDITICNDFTLNGGTFNNSNNRSVTVQNDLLLNASTYNNLAGTLHVARDFTQTAGVFSGGTGGSKIIERHLSVTNGTFTPGSGGGNIIRVNGNMTVATAATITSGTGGVTGQRFVFGGTANQLLTGTFTGTRAFNRLEISNAAGMTLSGNTTVNSELLLTSGVITTGATTFLMESSAVANPVEGRSTSYVDGKLYKVLANGQSFKFPIGKGARWRTGEVNSVSQVGNVTWDMEYFPQSIWNVVAAAPAPRNTPINNLISSDATILKVGGSEYWKVSDGSALSTGRTARVGISWGMESDVSANTLSREALTVMQWTGVNWANTGGGNFLPGHTQARGTVLSNLPLNFSENVVILGSTETTNPLPIELSKFSGEIIGEAVYLYWSTESELNNDRFEIQRSSDGMEFEVIGIVKGNGTIKIKSEYYFEDLNFKRGKNYYRLKQIDLDGASSLSKTIVLEYANSINLGLHVFPNPTAKDNITFRLSGISADEGEVVLRMFDLTGRIVHKSVMTPQYLSAVVSLKLETLKSGMYVLEVIQKKGRATQRVIIEDE